jgi:D-glycero-beta-D-manno-heptose 1-phosphate adenylyltransferase
MPEKSNFDSLSQKIVTIDNIKQRITEARANKKQIIFTNGCFDIIHPGHIEYLSKASDYGDIFILGLNTDNSIRKLKGSDRPILNQHSRAIILASMFFLDYIVLFDEETPYNIIQSIQPDILVKGGDYKAENIVGYDIVTKKGGKVITIPLTEGFSTTNIIKKMKEIPCPQ